MPAIPCCDIPLVKQSKTLNENLQRCKSTGSDETSRRCSRKVQFGSDEVILSECMAVSDEERQEAFYSRKELATIMSEVRKMAALLNKSSLIVLDPNICGRGIENLILSTGSAEAKRRKERHHRTILAIHRLKRQMGEPDTEDLRRLSEANSKLAVEKARRMADFDAAKR